MRHVRTPSILALAALCAIGVGLGPTGLTAGAQSVTRKLFISAVDKDSKAPIQDMKAADFEIKEGGKVVEISEAKVATTPLRIALIVADRGTGAFQLAALRFLEPLLGKGEFSIIALITQPEVVLDYSGSADAISEGLNRVGRRSLSTPGAQLVETVADTAKKIGKEGTRPVIVVMRSGGEGPSPIRAEAIREDLRKSGAALYALSTAGIQGIQRPTQATGPVTAAAASAANSNSELSEGMLTLGTILGDGAKDSGGRHEQNVATTLVPTMQQLASELLNQYEVTYHLPAGVKPNDRISVATKRKGVTLYAPSRLPPN